MKQKGKKDKGKRGELLAADKLNELFPGINASRGRYPEPDITHDYKGLHFEVKFTERIRLYEFMEQARRDAKNGEIPVVLVKQKYKDWLAVIPLEFLPLDQLKHE